jgi:hypothetical protein
MLDIGMTSLSGAAIMQTKIKGGPISASQNIRRPVSSMAYIKHVLPLRRDAIGLPASIYVGLFGVKEDRVLQLAGAVCKQANACLLPLNFSCMEKVLSL